MSVSQQQQRSKAPNEKLVLLQLFMSKAQKQEKARGASGRAGWLLLPLLPLLGEVVSHQQPCN